MSTVINSTFANTEVVPNHITATMLAELEPDDQAKIIGYVRDRMQNLLDELGDIFLNEVNRNKFLDDTGPTQELTIQSLTRQ